MEPAYSDLSDLVAKYSLIAVVASTILLIILAFVSLAIKQKSATLKKVLFLGFVLITVLCTLFLAGATIYLNVVSISGGPIHHHADFAIYKCGEELDLEDPVGVSNKVGTSTVHEHNDKRIHIEGVIVSELDASLGNFFRSTGGNFENNKLTIPGHTGQAVLKNGDSCDNVQNAQLQVFLFKVEGDNFRQAKLNDAKNYIISAEQNVPPGDCIIIELDKLKDKTDKLCQSFDAAVQTGKLTELKF